MAGSRGNHGPVVTQICWHLETSRPIPANTSGLVNSVSSALPAKQYALGSIEMVVTTKLPLLYCHFVEHALPEIREINQKSIA